MSILQSITVNFKRILLYNLSRADFKLIDKLVENNCEEEDPLLQRGENFRGGGKWMVAKGSFSVSNGRELR